MTREEEYRRRLQTVQVEVKRRLEYQLQLEQLQKQFEQRHLVSWLEDSVRQALLSKEVSLILTLLKLLVIILFLGREYSSMCDIIETDDSC